MKKRIYTLFVSLLACILSANAGLSKTDYSSNNYINEWGRLKLVGNQLSSQNGDTIQMRGVSTFSLNYNEVLPCLTKEGFSALKKWGCNVVRLAQYPQSSMNTYDETTATKVEYYIKMCNELGMYAIVDWNILKYEGMEGNPIKFKDEAKDFFSKISEFVYANNYKNVIYEICSDPSVSWENIIKYADYILPVIEKNDPQAIVIVGTPEASTDFTDVIGNPIEYKNLGIMYAYHHSVCDSESRLENVKKAAKELPIFVSEWWPTDANGDGPICTDKSDDFIDFLENGTSQAISWTYWAFGEKQEPSHMMTRCYFDDEDSNVSNAGKYIIPKFGYVQKKHTDLAPEIDCDETFPEIKILLKEDECSLSYDQMPFKINSIPVNPYTDEKAVVDTVRNDKNKITDPYFPGKYTIQWTFRYPSSELKTICNQTIDITDTIAPDFDCNSLPSTIKLYIADDAQTATYEQIKDAGFSIPQVYDKCDDAIVNVTREDGAKLDSVYPIGTTAISIKITDRYGNAVYCKQKIDIKKAIKHIDCDKMYPSVVLYTDSCSKSYDIEPIYINDSTDKFTFEASRTSGEDIEKPYYIGCDTINLKFIFESGSTEVCKQAICVKQTYKINCVKTDTIWFEKDNEDVFIPSDKLLPCIIDECTGEEFCPKITRSDSLAISDPLQVGETIINYTYTDHNEGEIYCEQVIIVIDNLTSIDNTDVDAIISVVPNPSNGQFEISVSEPSNISIFNSIGQKVFEKAIEEKSVITKPFDPGIYSVKAESRKSIRIIKLIVVK